MKTSLHFPSNLLVAALASTALLGCASTNQDVASAEHPAATHRQQDKAHDAASMLPPGWTEADMQACIAAGTPGPMHQKLVRGVGHWSGTTTMWMAPDTEPMKSQCTTNVSTVMDGRYTKCEFSGDMPGMGPYQGLGYTGFDNVSQKFVGSWMDNHSTGMMTGEGTLSNDGNTLTWTYRTNCPITKKQTTMREVDRFDGDNSMTLDMYGTDPKSNKEYHMMHIELTRQSP
jgi:hypothetical protein